MDSSIPLVSVIMPAYNEEKYIKRAVLSILNQTFDHLELIVVDDCSSDCTVEIIKSIDDDRIRIIENDSNQGVVRNLNIGISHAKGKFIARMDADDISLPTRFERQLAMFEVDSRCVVVGTGIFSLNYRLKEFNKIKPVDSDSLIRKQMGTHNPINTGSAMYKLSALEKVGGFNECDKRGEGFSILLKLSCVGSMRNVETPEYIYFIMNDLSNRSSSSGYKYRNLAMSEMVSRGGGKEQGGYSKVRRFLASFLWKFYSYIPRYFQILIRTIISGKQYRSLNDEEIMRLEKLYMSVNLNE